MSKTGQDCFAFTFSEIEAFANNQTVRRMNKERHSGKVVVVAKDAIRFEASFSKSEIAEKFQTKRNLTTF